METASKSAPIRPWKAVLSVADNEALDHLIDEMNCSLEMAQERRGESASLLFASASKNVLGTRVNPVVLRAFEYEFKHAGWTTAEATQEQEEGGRPYVSISISFGDDADEEG